MSGEDERWLKAETDTAYLMLQRSSPERQAQEILEHYARNIGLVSKLWEMNKLRDDIWRNGGSTEKIDEAILQGVETLKAFHRKDLGIALDWSKPPEHHGDPADRIAQYLRESWGYEGPRPNPGGS